MNESSQDLELGALYTAVSALTGSFMMSKRKNSCWSKFTRFNGVLNDIVITRAEKNSRRLLSQSKKSCPTFQARNSPFMKLQATLGGQRSVAKRQM